MKTAVPAMAPSIGPSKFHIPFPKVTHASTQECTARNVRAMAKLITLKPQIVTIKPLIGRATGDEKERLRQRDQEIEWRAWYGTERWKQMRERIWARDAYTCQVTGTICIGRYPAGNSPVADHKIPHRGDAALFWDENNIHTVSKEYHDSQKQREERAQARW